MQAMLLVIMNGALDALFQGHSRCPPRDKIKLRPGGVHAADVDRFPVFRERNNTIRTASGDFYQELNEFFERVRLVATNIEEIALRIMARARDQKRFDSIVNISKPAQLL